MTYAIVVISGIPAALSQTAIDAFYRVQLTPQLQFGPTLGIVFDPVDNPDEDTVFVGGLRARIYL